MAVTDGVGAEQGLDPLVFTVTRTGVTTGTTNVTLAWSGSATLTTDYTVGVSGATISANRLTLTFGPGQTVATVTLTPVDDTANEPQENVILTLVAAAGYTLIAPTSATGTIADNDTAPPATISVGNASVAEGKNGTTTVNVTFTRSGTTTTAVSATYATADNTATIANSDYQAKTGTVSFAAGQTSVTVAFVVIADRTAEQDETFFVNLTNPSAGAAIGTAQGVVTIQNDDGAPLLAVTAPAASAAPASAITSAGLEAVADSARAQWLAARPTATSRACRSRSATWTGSCSASPTAGRSRSTRTRRVGAGRSPAARWICSPSSSTSSATRSGSSTPLRAR